MGLRELVQMMVDHDIELARREGALNKAGFATGPQGIAMAV